MIEQAFRAYTKAVETKFEASRRPSKTKRRLVVWPNEEAQLLHLVEQLEEGSEFGALLEETRLTFANDRYHSKSEWSWSEPTCQFFRRTGYCTDTFFKVAMRNLIKTFFTEEIEQLLWHITALEAFLGEERGIRKSIAERSAAILSTTEEERRRCGALWKQP